MFNFKVCRSFCSASVALSLAVACSQPAQAVADGAVSGCPQAVITDRCFVPGDDCTAMIVRWIDKAQRQILMQAYSFTSKPIAAALVAAKARGVDVRAVVDKSQPRARGNQLAVLADANIPVQIEHMPGIAHNKILIIDQTWVETGSFNYTESAQRRNAENAVVFSGCGVSEYIRNWQSNAERSRPYDPVAAADNGDSDE